MPAHGPLITVADLAAYLATLPQDLRLAKELELTVCDLQYASTKTYTNRQEADAIMDSEDVDGEVEDPLVPLPAPVLDINAEPWSDDEAPETNLQE